MKQNSTPFDAEEYDRQIRRTLPFYEEMVRQIVDVVKNLHLQCPSWLDVGCGTGKMARAVLGNMQIEKMVCIDVEQGMLGRAMFQKASPQEARASQNEGKVEFLQCDVRELPYQEAFDVVTAVQVNHYFKRDERIAVLKKCYDALRENGVYISFENFAPNSEDGTRLYLERWKRFQIENGKTEEEADLHIGRYGRAYFPVTISESMEHLRNCGFGMVEVFWVSYMQVGIMARKFSAL